VKEIFSLQAKFHILTDENVNNAVSEQLRKRGVDATRVIDVVPAGTKDDDLLEYAYQHGYSIVTHDERIRKHVEKRLASGKEHCGVFIAGDNFQGEDGIGRIVEFVADYDALIKAGAASLQNDVYNHSIYIK
jgi:predicted nuclease of predicted toxin-antitoxin system